MLGVGAPSSSDKAIGDILIVDDEIDLRETVATLLEASGYCVRTSANGRDAVEAIERKRPAVILLDLMMPVMNGLEFLEWVEKSSIVSKDQVVVISAAGHRCPPGLPLVRKPFEWPELLAAIRERTSHTASSGGTGCGVS
jgi:DNA-binding response OmpR family regulator